MEDEEFRHVAQLLTNNPYRPDDTPETVVKYVFSLLALCGSVGYSSIIKGEPDTIDNMKPVLYGSRQEKGLRPGTEGVPVIAAFGAAAEKLVLTMDERYDAVSGLRSSLIEQLKEMDGVIIRDLPSASPYVLNISLLGYRSEIVLHYLEQREVYISSGSACSKGASSGVLELFGAKPAEVDSALRISFCSDNTEEDIAALVQGLKDAQKDLMH